MKEIDAKQITKRRGLGLVTMTFGLLVLVSPVVMGEWVISLLGLLLIGAGFFQIGQTLRSADATTSRLSYIAGSVTILLGLLLFLLPNLVLSGVVIIVMLFLVADGISKIAGALKQSGAERSWNLANGIATILLGVVGVRLLAGKLGIAAISLILGLRLLVEGWRMLLLPEKAFQPKDFQEDTRRHPDRRLRLEPSDRVKEMQDGLLLSAATVNNQNIIWCLMLLIIFLAIHIMRLDSEWSFIGFISPFTALLGDTIVAVMLAVVLALPLRLFWRKVSRPLERIAWRRLHHLKETNERPTLGQKTFEYWLSRRMRLALDMRDFRHSPNFALWRVLRIGLPLTAILIAVNSIWGFSWYFNSENWAAGVWQEITKERVDPWRKRMIQDVENDALAKGMTPEKVFAVAPEGVNDTGDFSFVVIGDTGEGDASQWSLHEQLIAASNRDLVKFLVLSSDVIYPDGRMKDYEPNFYLPFKGFTKPIYAIPGNHDWFDANEGFNANFFEPTAANLALRARLAEDVKTNIITTDRRFAELIATAKRLREYYSIRNGLQRGTFFEMHTAGFSLIAVDTGILRTIDDKEQAWLEAALDRAANNFKLVVLGHPFYVAGKYQGRDDPPFDAIHETLRRHQVDIAMAGDTHDFEFYREHYLAGGEQKQMLNFVNGGGGAYLSIGSSLDFPKQPEVSDYAFYPRTDQLYRKISAELPAWKTPFLKWMDWFGGYPSSVEALSGVFDFNRAPFFQSFMEIQVERSQHRVRLLLYGVNGQLRWRDIQVGGQTKPADKSDDDFVEFTVPLKN
ncbi:MAG TPA: metallophosphoesterase [Pyrinomonadaceae bacterium]|nr:metallophosphoesterase [Pyrinomonadaceae bacterium]